MKTAFYCNCVLLFFILYKIKQLNEHPPSVVIYFFFFFARGCSISFLFSHSLRENVPRFSSDPPELQNYKTAYLHLHIQKQFAEFSFVLKLSENLK